jgi:hypothetical protein
MKITSKYLIVIMAVTSLLLSQSCVYDPPRKGISVLNYTESAIYIAYSFDDTININHKLFLFEVEYYNDSKHIINPAYRIEAYRTRGIGMPGREELLNESPDKKIRLFFITEKVMKTKTWVDICKKKLYEKRVTLSISDLKKTNWMVRYP